MVTRRRGLLASASEGAQAAGELYGVDRIDGAKEPGGFVRLIRLQSADKVEARCGQVRKGGRFALHFLHIVFAELAQPETISFADRLRPEYFGDGQQTHGGGVAP